MQGPVREPDQEPATAERVDGAGPSPSGVPASAEHPEPGAAPGADPVARSAVRAAPQAPARPTPATLPRPRRSKADPPDPHQKSAEPSAPSPGGSDQPDQPTSKDAAPKEAEGGVAGALEATLRMIPNPATLMAAGRGMRKVRSTALRGRRLPKVEETSAGGVVLDLSIDPPAVALIARHDRRSRLLWSLPKGHVEAGETPEQAALREVHEETGLVGRILAPLGVIDFWFVVEDRRIHKTVHHYVIEAVGGELSDEDIEVEAVEWIPFHQVVRKLAYGDERRLVEKVPQIVAGVK